MQQVHIMLVEFHAANGHVLKTSRRVDTPSVAALTAEVGIRQDEIDGGETRYTLMSWTLVKDEAQLDSVTRWGPGPVAFSTESFTDDGEDVWYGEGSGWTGYSTGE